MQLPQLSAPSLFDPLKVTLRGVQLIEASAGTGKTWNISALYLRALIEHKLTVEQLLVVTFTKAATAELRDRIRGRIADLYALIEPVESWADLLASPSTDRFLLDLVEWLKSKPADEINDLKPRLKLALQSFDQATIFTIHGFCQRALDDAPFVSGAPLGSELIPDDSEIREERVQDYWRCKVLALDADPMLVRALSLKALNPKKLSEIVQLRLSKPLAHLIWPNESVNLESARKHEADLMDSWTKLQKLWHEDRAGICAPIAKMIALQQLSKVTFKESSFEQAQQDWTYVLQSGPWTELVQSKLHLLNTDALKPTQEALRKGATVPEHAFYLLAKHYLDAKEQLSKQADLIVKDFVREMLDTVVPKIKEHKRTLRIYSFDDMLGNLRDALMGTQGEALAHFLRTQFPIALVDEFQDTDPLQLAILEKIYIHDQSESALFLVGDPKQAIYSFRNADLPTYLRARAQASARWTLTQNQRASQALIDACNTVFTQKEHAFLQEGLLYQSVSMGEKKRTILEDDTQERAALNVWLLPQDNEGAYFNVTQARVCSAESCASEIVRLLNAGRNNQIRLAGRGLLAGDIAVLVRSHLEGLLMREALSQRGVACVERSPMNIFKTPDAEEWLCLLRALAEPRHVGKVLAALATRMLGYNAQKILELKQSEHDLELLMGHFMRYHALWLKRGFGAAVRNVLDDFKVFEMLLVAPDGLRRMTNLQHLMEWLQDISRLHQGPLALLRQFEEVLRREQGGEEQEQRLETDAHLVQIMTIHRSKGLEFPVVFCPFIWTSVSPERGQGMAREYHDDEGNTVMDFRGDALIDHDRLTEIKEAQHKEREAEYVRLIYVALTRASLRCYLVAGVFAKKNKEDPTKVASQSPLNRLIEHAGLQNTKPKAMHELEQRWHDLAASTDHARHAIQVCTLIEPSAERFEVLAEPAPLFRAEEPPRSIPYRFRVDSFSGLQKQGETVVSSTLESDFTSSAVGKDHDGMGDLQEVSENEAVETEAEDIPQTGKRISSSDILKFPRGKHEGTFLHKVLEHADLSRAESWPALIQKTLDEFSQLLNLERAQIKPEKAREMVLGMVRHIAECQLPQGFSLQAVSRTRQFVELEFYLPIHQVSPHALYALLQRHDVAIPRYQFEVLDGYLKGFIDLVFEHHGQWFVLDWKSNHLGDHPQDYADQPVQTEMNKHGYVLQAVLYSLALHRLLKQRLPDYSPSKHLGGVLYVFLRGFREQWRGEMPSHVTPGLWSYQPTEALLTDLDLLFDGQAGEGSSNHA